MRRDGEDMSSSLQNKQNERKREKSSRRIRFSRDEEKLALLGWSLQCIEAADNLKKPFLVVAPPVFEEFAEKHDIPFMAWDFEKYKDVSCADIYDYSEELYEILKTENVRAAVPLFEETVEWGGAINARIRNDYQIFNNCLLCRNKAMMKRRAQMAGLWVGVFEEVKDKEEAKKFLKRVKSVLDKRNGEGDDPIHFKAFDKAGTVGHRVAYSEEDIDNLEDSLFPCLAESHLKGKEFSCEAFIHDGKIRFLNISDYVVFEHSIMVPPPAEIEEKRENVRNAVQRIVDYFGIDYGLLHSEFFLNSRGELHFGETAARIPGGHIFDLIERAYNFNPFEGYILCCDPKTTEEELNEFFPDEKSADGHASCIMAYPKVKYISDIDIPEDLEQHPCFEKHDMFVPAVREVPQVEGNGNHYGAVFLFDKDGETLKQPIMTYVDHDYYV